MKLTAIKQKYHQQKGNAKSRGVDFHLTFEEWWDIWQQSGFWDKRGKQVGQYCMSRIGDTGPYAVGNVFIQLASDNMMDRWRNEMSGPHNKDDLTYIGKFAINEKKFFSKLIEDDNKCLVWQGGTHRQNYGMMNIYDTEANKKKMNVTHRIAMMLHLGRELGRDEFVIHEFCDNQLCCNPEHMIVGTAYDRNRVQYAKGRRPVMPTRPEQTKKQNRTYKYSDEDMLFCRANDTKAIAKRLGITRGQASYLKHKFTNGYKWLK